jgi:dTDP-glucose 4,6-dehydratase
MKPVPPLPETDLLHILDRTAPLWRELSGARLFVTGGSGFFGIWFLETLAAANARLNAGVDITVLSRAPERVIASHPHLSAVCTWHLGDVRDFVFPEGEFSHIIHAATSTDARFNSASPSEALDTIVSGTRRVLDFARHSKARKLLLTSSGAVYGPQPKNLAHLPEDYAGAPDATRVDSVYAEGKRVAELQLAIASDNSGLEAKIARCFTFVGPLLPLDWHFAIGNFLRDALTDNDLIIKGDGRPLRSYLHAADLVIWLLTILMQGQSMRPYNVGSQDACSIADLAQRVAALSGTKGKVRILSEPATGPAPRYVPDTRRAREELGLEQTIALDDAIARTLSWLRRKHP